MKKFEEPFKPLKFIKTVEYFTHAYNPSRGDYFKRNVASKILNHINSAEL